MSAPAQPLLADLVLEGGGVKGVALSGAVAALGQAGYGVPRVAGSSAGAIVAALVAALQRAGEPLTRLTDIADTLDYSQVPDSPLPHPLRLLSEAFSLVVSEGLHPGDYLRGWLRGVLRDLGVATFGDLRSPDPVVQPEHRWRLVVTASDLSARRLLRLPWDYPLLGLDPDEQDVVTAVSASAAIPFYFRPVRFDTPRGRQTLVDGGLLSNFPVALFDRTDGGRPRWPTFGIKLSARTGHVPVVTTDTGNPLTFSLALIETVLAAQDSAYIDAPCVQDRTIFIDTGDTSAIDFGISRMRRLALWGRGADAARALLSTWDEAAYDARCR